MSALTLVLGEYFECRFGGDNSLTGGNEVVAAVAVLYFNDVVLIAEARNVFFENNLHNISFGKGVIS